MSPSAKYIKKGSGRSRCGSALPFLEVAACSASCASAAIITSLVLTTCTTHRGSRGPRHWRAPRATGVKEGRLTVLSDARRGPVRWVPIGNCVLPARGMGYSGQAGAAAAIADSIGAPMRFWNRFTSLLSFSTSISFATSLRSMPKVRLNHEKRLTQADHPEN